MMDCSNTKSRMPNFMRGVAVQVVGESRVRHHITLLVFAVIYCVVITVVRSSYEFASDYAINSTAAVAGARGVSLYDRETLRHLAVERIGAEKRGLIFRHLFKFHWLTVNGMGVFALHRISF